ncbi:1-acyl-sn-glycerol-3-phosphate acyltransferase [Tropicibacter naphthalenivorans]|uniref:Glycerol-3-phosphate acyltransferase n=1 Tax=Tropicibacter naphthalenivorans TaxID=441103 RepID=A0A0N7LZK9_9RHOB|nr:1-acyl-sn-glycerol-3-phosphate acyltransferase [Tropicibacter naphthalenivorans]CUH77953.1 Glycerol-3-phosphate acyltransferase [Tropicibacter naphthalenivorans]SMC94945.1 glycerol-3-phosphate acyltransferase [Tropicibacter naphthalenivorans]
MNTPVTLPLWLFALILGFAGAAFATNFLFPSVRWFFRRRMERAVARLNKRLARPIEPFKLLRRYDLIQRLVYHPEVTQAAVDYARAHDLREDVAVERARDYAREIVPSFSALAYFGWGVRLARWLSNALYRVRLQHHDPAELTGIHPEATVVFVMNHRSNMDYVLVTHLAASRSALSYAVGEWARVWPLSVLIRSMGAYFIRRKSRDDLYRKVLRRYVQMATIGGSTQAIFPEGGLSLTGAPQPPKVGLLTYMCEAARDSGRDIVFVPVGLNYDRVLEDRVLVAADQAGTRRFDTSVLHVFRAVLKQLWLRLTGRYHRFGYAAVSFGVPVSLSAQPDLASDPQALADALMDRIARIIPVLPVPLVAQLLIEGPKTRAELDQAAAERIKTLSDCHVHLPRDDVAYAVEVGLRALTERGIATAEPHQITPDGQGLAEFYAASIRHLC